MKYDERMDKSNKRKNKNNSKMGEVESPVAPKGGDLAADISDAAAGLIQSDEHRELLDVVDELVSHPPFQTKVRNMNRRLTHIAALQWT